MKSPTKVLCIGLDSADKGLLLDWAEQGRLPAIRSLLARAAWGTVENQPGLFVGSVWPTFYTGVTPARHGRYCFAQLRAGTYEVARVHADQVEVEPFWLGLSRAGKRIALVDVPKTTTAEELNGVQVVDWATHDPEPPGLQTVPRSLRDELEPHTDPSAAACDTYAIEGRLPELRDVLVARTEGKTRFVERLLLGGGWDLFLAVFAEAHCAGHQFWHAHDPTHYRHGESRKDFATDPLPAVYSALDRSVGQLLAHVPSTATVVVLASHGMASHYSGTHVLDGVLRRLESLPPAPDPHRLRTSLLPLWRQTPRPLRALLRPLAHAIAGTPGDVRQRVDPGRRFFTIPNNDVWSGIRINLVGREPRGLVSPGAEYDQVCASLERDLRELVNPATRGRAVLDVVRTERLYDGPRLGDLPDLLVEWNREAPIDALYSPKTGRIDKPYAKHRTGDHTPDGLFLALGPSVEPGPLSRPVSMVDFAPTIASLLGVAVDGLDGRALPEIIGRGKSDQSPGSLRPRASTIVQ